MLVRKTGVEGLDLQHVRDDLVNCGILERRFGALGVRVPVEDPKCQVTITG
jgi:hypothetical protein